MRLCSSSLAVVAFVGWQSVTALSTAFQNLSDTNLDGAIQLANAQDDL